MGIRHFAIVTALGASGLVSCGGSRSAAVRSVAVPPSTSTTVVASAHVNASPVVRSCVGPSLCREDVLATADPDALAEVEEACQRHGGTFGPLLCAREGAVARCSAGSEYGTVSVYAYDRSAGAADTIALVSKQCEAFEGSFEKLATLP